MQQLDTVMHGDWIILLSFGVFLKLVVVAVLIFQVVLLIWHFIIACNNHTTNTQGS